MKRLVQKVLQPLIAILLCATVTVTLADALWAQSRRGEAEPPKEPSFVTGYIVLLIMLGLGLAVICRPALRSGGGDDEQ